VLQVSHHRCIEIDGIVVGHVRITNAGEVLSIWISTEVQQKLFLPEEEE
jgi:hypothetical protein